MKAPINWLKKYVKIDSDNLDDLVHKLTLAGTEVESIQRQGNWAGIVVAEILEVKKHPNADRLHLVLVNDRGTKVNVVCGASNLYKNQKVAFAPVGSKIFSPKTNQMEILNKTKIRGEASNGMICSALELGLGDDHDGIMDLNKDLGIGVDLKEIYNDIIIELELTPNRPDCLGIYGIAREISAITSQKLEEISFDKIDSKKDYEENLEIKIIDPDLCLRYMGAVISNIKIEESPEWLKSALDSIGETPINNIVDITNYVMFELGQPLHAFDYHKINDDYIEVRRAKDKEYLVTLDGVKRDLNSKMLVIADSKSPIAVAGIKGGLDSGITDSTNSIVLEAACFEGSNNRNTASKLDLKSQATLRFEKNLRPELCEVAFKRAIDLIKSICDGKLSSEIIDVGNYSKTEPIVLSKTRLDSILGAERNIESVSEIFKRLGFDFNQAVSNSGAIWVVEAPYWRPDINIYQDLVEEVARIEGYESIPSTPLSGVIPEWNANSTLDFYEYLKDILVSLGLNEVINYSADSLKNIKSVHPSIENSEMIKILNPMSKELEYMKPTLKSGMIKSLNLNSRNLVGNIKLFELGTSFIKSGDGKLPIQKKLLSCGIIGSFEKELWEDERLIDIYDAKGLIEGLFNELRIAFEIIPAKNSIFTKDNSYKITVNGDEIGIMGELSNSVLSNFEIKNQNLFLIEIEADKLHSKYIPKSDIKYASINKYPSSRRDLSFIIENDLMVNIITDVFNKNSLVLKSEVIDIYKGKYIEDNSKSVTVRTVYGSSDKTLSGEEIDNCEKQILSTLENKINFKIRS